MKYLLTILLSFCVPLVLFAHTSDERYVDGMIVDLSTAPVAPWVGEKTGFLFSFLDPENFRVIESVMDARVEIVATFRENGKPQEVVFSGATMPVVRGTLNFEYTFSEEGTYDVHIIFHTKDGEEHVSGYRRQIRNGNLRDTDPFILPMLFVLGCLFGVLVGYVFTRKRSIARL